MSGFSGSCRVLSLELLALALADRVLRAVVEITRASGLKDILAGHGGAIGCL